MKNVFLSLASTTKRTGIFGQGIMADFVKRFFDFVSSRFGGLVFAEDAAKALRVNKLIVVVL